MMGLSLNNRKTRNDSIKETIMSKCPINVNGIDLWQVHNPLWPHIITIVLKKNSTNLNV